MDDNFIFLRDAILVQTIKDYTWALQNIGGHTPRGTNKFCVGRTPESLILECENFFTHNNDFFDSYDHITGKEIMHLCQQYIKSGKQFKYLDALEIVTGIDRHIAFGGGK